MDTKDNIEEFYTTDELKTFSIEIIGFKGINICKELRVFVNSLRFSR